jgi:8-oxo-dGTP diphosphatase
VACPALVRAWWDSLRVSQTDRRSDKPVPHSPLMQLQVCTLAIPVSQSGNVLLGTRARGFGAGKVCGFGGKPELSEDVGAAALRELLEETTLTADEFYPLRQRGRLYFSFECRPGFILRIDVFMCRLIHVDAPDVVASRGDEFSSPLAWYPTLKLPLHDMWPDAAVWLPLLLSGGRFEKTFKYRDMEGRREDLVLCT